LATRRMVSENRALLGLIMISLAVLLVAVYGLQRAADALEGAVAGLPLIGGALLATTITALVTGAGALPVLFTRTVSARTQTTMLGFAAGVMLAASIFSLLLPALEAGTAAAASRGAGATITAIGLLLGAGLLLALDYLVPHEHSALGERGINPRHVRRVWLFVFAITLHNVPEGLAVGVAFGAVAAGENGVLLASAVALTIGIGLQNMPEGLAVALPLRREGFSRFRAFWYGQLSASVEPVAAVIGAAAVILIQPALPIALAFAAGAMLFVVIEQLIPESQSGGNTDLVTLATVVGFVLMMSLDVALG
jgi:zinc transporter, ZIP family